MPGRVTSTFEMKAKKPKAMDKHVDTHVAVLNEDALCVFNFTVTQNMTRHLSPEILEGRAPARLLLSYEGPGMQLFKATLYRRDESIGGYGEEIDTKRGKEWAIRGTEFVDRDRKWGVALEGYFDVAQNYTLVAETIPVDDIDLIPNWRIDIFDNEVKRGVVRGILRNTNDADIVGDYVAYRKNVIVRYVRAPPLTPIQVVIECPDMLDPRGRHNLAEWRLIAPFGYAFYESCDCMDKEDILYPRVAILDGMIRQYTMDVLTPRDLTQRPWVLEGWNTTIMTYAENEGFPLIAMPCGVYYPRIASSIVPILITFESELEFTGIKVETELNITCDLGPGYLQRFLLECDEGDPGYFGEDPFFIHAKLTIPAGAYGFTSTVDLPDPDHPALLDPARNMITVFIVQRQGTAVDIMGNEYFVDTVLDSHPDIEGFALTDYNIYAPTQEWTSNKPAKPSLITIGITVGSPIQGMQAMTLYLPDGYTLNSAKRMDVAILSDNFPRKKDREFDLSRLTQITYFVAGTIPTGRHAFRFPVYLPQRTTQNFWIFAFCKQEQCQTSDADLVYPFAGLTIGSGQTTDTGVEEASAERLACALALLALALRL